jgi:ParB-like nuclease domain
MAKRTAVAENRYKPYEDKLRAHGLVEGVDWEYVGSVPLSDISRYPDSQARMRLAGSDLIKETVEKMRAGESYPPLVIGEDEAPNYVLLDGNRRLAAKTRLKYTHTDAYVVKLGADKNEAVYLSGLFNTINGVGLDKDEIIRAVRAARALSKPMNDTRITKDYGVSASMLSRISAVDAYDARAATLGLTTDIPESIKVPLSKFGDDSVLRSALDLVLDAELKSKDIRMLGKSAAAATSEAERLKVIADERETLAPTIAAVASGRISTAPPSKDSLLAFGRLHKLIERFPDPEDWVPIRTETRDDWAPRITEIRDFLARLVDAYADSTDSVRS